MATLFKSLPQNHQTPVSGGCKKIMAIVSVPMVAVPIAFGGSMLQCPEAALFSEQFLQLNGVSPEIGQKYQILIKILKI
jgi:hypothetical protein